MTTFLHVVGARPNFMKVAPLLRAMDEGEGCSNVLVHTGQGTNMLVPQRLVDVFEKWLSGNRSL